MILWISCGVFLLINLVFWILFTSKQNKHKNSYARTWLWIFPIVSAILSYLCVFFIFHFFVLHKTSSLSMTGGGIEHGSSSSSGGNSVINLPSYQKSSCFHNPMFYHKQQNVWRHF